MSSVLDKIYKNSEEVKDRVESIDDTLQRLYKAEVKENKQEDKDRKAADLKRKRELQQKKRDAADKKTKGIFGSLTKEEKKKEGNVLMDIIKGALGGVFKALSSGLGMLGTLVSSAFAGLAGLGLGGILKGALGKLSKLLLNPKTGLIALAYTVIRGSGDVQNAYNKNFSREGRTKTGIAFTREDIADFMRSRGGLSNIKDPQVGMAANLAHTMREAGRHNNQAYIRQERIKNYDEQIEEYEKLIAEGNTDPIVARNLEVARKRRQKANDELYNHLAEKAKLVKRIEELYDKLEITDQELINIQIESGRRRRTDAPSWVDPSEAKNPAWYRNFFGYDYNDDFQAPEGYQTGGFTVPGNSTGDRHPYMLPPGSFILNRNAAEHFQSGGSAGLSPVLLESREKVLLPGDPMMPMAMMMNSMIPRFQTGGYVGAPRSSMVDTGEVDAKGRKVLLSPAAAAAWEQMMQAGMPYNPADITNVYRDEAEYNRLIGEGYGAASNSRHNHGEAADIHGAMNSWIRQHGSKYGWVAHDYSGSHGGHFEFRGTGAGSTPTVTGDAEAALEQGTGNGMESMFSGLGNAGIFASTVIGGIGDFLGQKVFGEGFSLSGLFGGAMGGISNLFGGSDNSTSSSIIPGSSEPLTGDIASKAKSMYDYIVSKGYSPAQAKGIVANIHRESTFNAKARSGDDGGPGGLFQWKGSRQTSKVDQLVRAGDWKGQIDYALREDAGPRYLSETKGMTAQQAADWWMREWERPADPAAGSRKHSQFLDSYQFQQGGLTNVRGNRSSLQNSTQMIRAFGEAIAESNSAPPIIIYDDEPQAAVHVATDSSIHQTPPEISTAPSATPAKHYMFYDLNYGPVV